MVGGALEYKFLRATWLEICKQSWEDHVTRGACFISNESIRVMRVPSSLADHAGAHTLTRFPPPPLWGSYLLLKAPSLPSPFFVARFYAQCTLALLQHLSPLGYCICDHCLVSILQLFERPLLKHLALWIIAAKLCPSSCRSVRKPRENLEDQRRPTRAEPIEHHFLLVIGAVHPEFSCSKTPRVWSSLKEHVWPWIRPARSWRAGGRRPIDELSVLPLHDDLGSAGLLVCTIWRRVLGWGSGIWASTARARRPGRRTRRAFWWRIWRSWRPRGRPRRSLIFSLAFSYTCIQSLELFLS